MKFDSIYIQLVEAFNKNEDEAKGTGYMILRLSVPMKLLHELYNKFLKDGIEPIENIDQSKKMKYFTIASTFYEDLSMRIKASKAAYVLDLITSNE